MLSSNGIGFGSIGNIVIGGDEFDWEGTIISQYAFKPKLVGMLMGFCEAVEQKPNLFNFYDDLWNVATATGYGLDVWGRIVVVSRTLTITSRFLGFAEGNGNQDYDPFNISPFFSGNGLNSSVTLQDDAYRVLIMAKAAANICAATIAGINNILQTLFPMRGPCYVTDNQDMTMTYTFGFKPTPVEKAIILTSNVLPRPAGVQALFSLPPGS